MKTLEYVIQNNGLLPEPKEGIEYHPYLKFEKQQNQNASKYIIGTFPPVSYLFEGDKAKRTQIQSLFKKNIKTVSKDPPLIPFFHGNRLSMWKLLLSDSDLKILNETKDRDSKVCFLIQWLKDNDLYYSDIISSCRRKQYNAKDSNLVVVGFNKDLIESIMMNKNAKAILFNTSGIFNSTGIKVYISNSKDKLYLLDNWKQGDVKPDGNKSFNLFLRALQEDFTLFIKSYKGTDCIEINSNNSESLKNCKFKALTKLKISPKSGTPKTVSNKAHIEREFIVCTGPSPSGAISLRRNEVFKKWEKQNSDKSPKDFIKHVYGNFIMGEWSSLAELNV